MDGGGGGGDRYYFLHLFSQHGFFAIDFFHMRNRVTAQAAVYAHARVRAEL